MGYLSIHKIYIGSVIVLFAFFLASCGTLVSQQYLTSHCDESDGPLPNIYSGVIFDFRGTFHYGCTDHQCKYFNYEGTNNIELFLILDMPLSLALDTALLPLTVYRQSRSGDICKVQPESAGAGKHLVSIDVKPLNRTISKRAVQQFSAVGTYSNGTVKDISTIVVWSSSDMSKVTIDGSGVATAVEAGTVMITAQEGKIVGSSMLTASQ